MSFSSEVKEELFRQQDSARHCQMAELSAYVLLLSNSAERAENEPLLLHAENENLKKKCFTLLKKTYNIENALKPGSSEAADEIWISPEKSKDIVPALSPSVCLKNSCCKRAFLRGAYLATGSMSDPSRSYHLEFVCRTDREAECIREQLIACDLDGKVTKRRNSFVVYLKEGADITTFLSLAGACVSMMNMENTRILKEIGNTVNRQVNCEAANMKKSVETGARQKADIEFLSRRVGLQNLPEPLREAARLRMELPEETTLKEMAEMMNPPITKSGLNHRLKKLSDLAQELRDSEG